MTSLEARIASTRRDFVDALESHGFRLHDDRTLHGSVSTASGRRQVAVELGLGWPFDPPLVRATEPVVVSWHQNHGLLCVYPDAGHHGLPWLSAGDFLRKVAAWFEQSDKGWPDDPTDLDLERYFFPADPPFLVLHDDLRPLVGKYVKLRKGANRTLKVTGAGGPLRSQRGGFRFGYCADLGTLRNPVRDWDGLRDLLPEPDVDVVLRRIRDGTVIMLLLRYDRTGHEGVLALSVVPHTDGGVGLTAHQSASTTAAVTGLRAGPHRERLGGTAVAVVGCGAIGSFLVDQLVRAGVGSLTLVDSDLLRPGNLVRHLAGQREVGLPKAEAVRQALIDRPYNRSKIVSQNVLLRLPADAIALFDAHDLVVDATADGSATALLHHAADATGQHIVSVCVQNDGATVRVDLLPPLAGTEALPPTPQQPPALPQAYEGGCGSPVSPTPPHAVAEAAALGARHACGLLINKPVHPAGEVRDNLPAGVPVQL